MNLHLRPLTIQDLPFCKLLVTQAGWNQIDTDWKRLMDLDPAGCFIGTADGQDAGSIAFTRFPADPYKRIPSVAWISMVLVEKSFRGRGIGSEIFRQVLYRLESMNVGTIRLDATDQGYGLYRKFGFHKEYHLIRMICEDKHRSLHYDIASSSTIDPNELADYDMAITQTNRYGLFDAIIRQADTLVLQSEEKSGHGIKGYVCVRPGRTGIQIGPCVANNPETGISLLDQAIETVEKGKIIIDIPANNTQVMDWARRNHFTEQRRFLRMYHGTPLEDQPEKIFASFGPEKG